jgi:DNA-binding beta-propeller fold protein YncE
VRAATRRRGWAVCAACAATLALPAALAPPSFAASDQLTFTGCIKDAQSAAACGGSAAGLKGANSVAVSSDGRSVYVASNLDSAVVAFRRDPTSGALTPAGCVEDAGAGSGCAASAPGLEHAISVAVSPDGKSAYAVSAGDSAIVSFDRDPISGALSFEHCYSEAVVPGCDPSPDGGLGNSTALGPEQVTVSPDGESVYVASFTDDAVSRFDRDLATGALTPAGCVAQNGGACAQAAAGLGNSDAVTVSPDGKSVYVGSIEGAVVQLTREPSTGAITPADCVEASGRGLGCGQSAVALDGVDDVAVSPDGGSVYAASLPDDAITRFGRDATSGGLTPAGCVEDAGAGSGCAESAAGLDGAGSIAISPDGTALYAVGPNDLALTILDRDPASGALMSHGCIDAELGRCAQSAAGLDSPTAVTASPDGRSVYVTSTGDDAILTFAVGAPPAPSPPPPSPPVPAPAPSPSVRITSGPRRESARTSAAFTFAGTPGGSFQCSLDGGRWTACSSGQAYSHLLPGDHLFRVRELLGGRTSAPASYRWTIDLPRKCVLRVARARVFVFAKHDKARLVIHYTSYRPAKVRVSYRLAGRKGGLELGSAGARFKRAGVFRLPERLTRGQMAKLRAARRFTVRFKIPRTPHSCGRYYMKRLTIHRRVSGQTVWFQSDSRFAPAALATRARGD